MMSSSLSHAHVGCYVLDRLIHTSGKKKKNKPKKKQHENTNVYSADYDVNGTIEQLNGTKEQTF